MIWLLSETELETRTLFTTEARRHGENSKKTKIDSPEPAPQSALGTEHTENTEIKACFFYPSSQLLPLTQNYSLPNSLHTFLFE